MPSAPSWPAWRFWPRIGTHNCPHVGTTERHSSRQKATGIPLKNTGKITQPTPNPGVKVGCRLTLIGYHANWVAVFHNGVTANDLESAYSNLKTKYFEAFP